MGEHYWEVAIVRDGAARVVLAENVPTDQLWAYFVEAGIEYGWGVVVPPSALEPSERRALGRILDKLRARFSPPTPAAISVTRMDWTPEARRAKWEADFYDVDRNGRRRRRYRRPQIERDWEEMLKRQRKEEREKRQVRNRSSR